MQDNQEYFELGEAMEDDDWALIISADGDLKGLYIPAGKEEDLVPESIVTICEEYFGIDLNDEGAMRTLH